MNMPSQISTFQLEELNIEGFERVVEIKDKESGLHTIIAIHSTKRGPGLGGVRMYPYSSREAALKDVLRLSEGMTYKSALLKHGLGGGKAVIIADPKKDKSPELLNAFGRAVELFEGQYITAQDSGMSPEDLKIIRQSTRYVVGLKDENSSGDPAPYTAWGNFWSIIASCSHLFGFADLEGKTIAIQGLGNVGTILCDLLYWHGAHLKVCDIDPAKEQETAHRYGAEVIDCAEILTTPCDILVPCALGGIITEAMIPLLNTKIICGSANNQLDTPEDADRLKARGILYAPDFIVNSGGAINVTAEIEPDGYDTLFSRTEVRAIGETLLEVFECADQENISTYRAALEAAQNRIDNNIGKRTEPPKFHH